MQFFHLVSFVVVVSYAAALPQPAGLSEKYSNNANTNLASGLEARSYQPDQTLTKRDDGPGTPPPPGSKDIKKILYDAFKRGDFSSANISSTIYKVGDGMVHLYVDGPKAGAAVGSPAGDMLTRYIKRLTM
ncbi:hypothetical protein BASA50_008482 [Batrachochytrium salamandrivorans]|uniref:Uncharacterized protein n=1 Tax=Batrachochytrium salamandrivorans TaxID=1357716 RepID=A0ABQ8F6W3_9FUNG|nr:hypothetical protein BASA50_008482 [Batrachochytrium salamandrivorans]